MSVKTVRNFELVTQTHVTTLTCMRSKIAAWLREIANSAYAPATTTMEPKSMFRHKQANEQGSTQPQQYKACETKTKDSIHECRLIVTNRHYKNDVHDGWVNVIAHL